MTDTPHTPTNPARATLEDLNAGAVVTGIDPAGPVTVVTARWHGTQAITLVYHDQTSQIREQMVFRSDEGTFSIAAGDGNARNWSFDADGHLFRLVAEARRIRLAHLFDPNLAPSSSQVDPYPTRSRRSTPTCQPLRFLHGLPRDRPPRRRPPGRALRRDQQRGAGALCQPGRR